MLGYLRGKIISKSIDSSQCVLLAHRVGYELSVSKNLFEVLQVGQSVEFWVHTHVREDALTLFGFATESDKNFFRLLIGVSGLGPKTAMALIATHGAEKLTRLLTDKEVDEISEAPGVGKKLAQRLVLELSSKVEKLQWILALDRPRTEVRATASGAVPARRQLREDLASALTNLGYQPNVIKSWVEKHFETAEAETEGFEVLLKSALKDLSGRPMHG